VTTAFQEWHEKHGCSDLYEERPRWRKRADGRGWEMDPNPAPTRDVMPGESDLRGMTMAEALQVVRQEEGAFHVAAMGVAYLHALPLAPTDDAALRREHAVRLRVDRDYCRRDRTYAEGERWLRN